MPQRPADLSRHRDFAVGPVRVSPARLALGGPAGQASVEARVMQVLVTLAAAAGEVVSRQDLVAICWNGQVVGDDSLNRAISELRRALAKAGAADAIETVPKVGYRLAAPAAPPAMGWTRRAALGGGVAAVAAGGGWLALRHPRREPAVDQLIDRARQAIRDDYPDAAEQGEGFLREAVARAPDDAEAWGLLALARQKSAEFAPVPRIGASVAACQQAAGRALRLDPRQPEAAAALALLPPIYGDWLAAERRTRAALAQHPSQPDLLGALGLLLISVGRLRDGAAANARALAIEPMSPVFLYRRAYHLWFAGDLAAADAMIDRGMQLWPRHPAIWYARLLLFGLTGRARAALAMLDGAESTAMMGAANAAAWRAGMRAALGGARAEAVAINLQGAARGASGAVQALLLVNLLGDADAAFTVADAYYLRRGPLLSVAVPPAGAAINDQRWKKTMVLFTPTLAPMRADPRFAGLCEEMGLAGYWRESRIGPDYLGHA